MRLKEFLKDGGDVNNVDNQWNNMSISARTNYIKNDLLRRGYTMNQAAAILGNLLQENRSLNTHTTNTSSGALGIAQWLGSRKKSIISQGKHSTISGQLDFLDQEIKGKGAWTNNIGGKNAFFNSDDPKRLTMIFRKDFERPGEHEARDDIRLKNTYNVLGQKYTPSEYDNNIQNNSTVSTGLPSDMKPVEYNDMKSYLKSNPNVIQYFNPEVQDEFYEQSKLENEKLQQDQLKSEAEYQNQQLQMMMQEKQKEKEQILSMIPQSNFVGSGNLQPNPLKLMQKGGWTPFSKRSVNPEAIKTFYNDMINSSWYKDRLRKNGYDSNLDPANWFSDGAQNEADFRSRRVQYSRVNKIDTKKIPFSAQEALRYKDLNSAGTHWMPRTNEVIYKMNDDLLDYYNIEPMEVVTHEMGHAESAGRLNNYEFDLLKNNLSNRTESDHDRDPNENKADINTLRYNLFREGLYDPKTGKYKTKTGRFEKSLLEKVKSSFMSKRLRQNYDDDKLEMLMNTIAMNESDVYEQPVYTQKGGKVVSEIWKEKTGLDWSEARNMGLTDGSYDKNIELLNRLKNNEIQISTNPTQVQNQPELDFEDLPKNARIIPDVELNREYSAWVSDKKAVTDSNMSLNRLERDGHVQLIKGKNDKIKTDQNGNYLYKILTNEYKDTFNNWIKTLNTGNTEIPAPVVEQPKEKTRKSGFLNSIESIVNDIGNTIEDGASDVKDLFQQAYNYADRHFLDDTEVNTKKIVTSKPTANNKPKNVFDDQINMTDIEVGKGKAASGIINLNSNKFVSRNRGDFNEVKNGKGIAVTLFNPMNKDLDKSYKQFPEVMALKKDGSVEIMARDKVNKNDVEAITRTDRLPWDKLDIVNKNGKDYVKVENSNDFNGKIVSMGGYNSGIGVGKTNKEYIPIDEANKYSKLIGGKVVMKAGKQEILVSGSFKDMYEAYKLLEQKTKEKPVVYKLDNGSFNTTYFKDNNTIDSDDLRQHQNRNRGGGHALILLNK